MNIRENDQCLITLCPINQDPNNENLIKLKCRDTEEILVTSEHLLERQDAFYKNAINLSLYDDLVIYQGSPYRIIHMLTISYDYFMESYQHKYQLQYRVEQS